LETGDWKLRGGRVSRLSKEIKRRIMPVLRRHDVVHAAIFGSFATGVANESSDLDIVVEFEGEKSLLDLVALQLELEDVLGMEVDVLTYQALHPRIKERVLREQVQIL